MRITDAQWTEIEPILKSSNPSTSLRASGGRPRLNDRQVVNGIVWILLNGTQWSELPSAYGSYVTCWRRYSLWMEKGIWGKIWEILVRTMDRKQLLEWSMALGDGAFLPVKK